MHLVPPFPGVVAIVEAGAGHEGGLAEGEADGVALQQEVAPLEAQIPRLAGIATKVDGVGVAAAGGGVVRGAGAGGAAHIGVEAPAGAD